MTKARDFGSAIGPVRERGGGGGFGWRKGSVRGIDCSVSFFSKLRLCRYLDERDTVNSYTSSPS